MLAYRLANVLRTPAPPATVAHWSLTMLREKLVKINTNVMLHAGAIVFQMAEVAVPKSLFWEILRLVDGLRPARALS